MRVFLQWNLLQLCFVNTRKRSDPEAGAEEEEDQRVQASACLLEEALLCPLHDSGTAV